MTTPAWAPRWRTVKLSCGVGLGPSKMKASPPSRAQTEAASSQKCREIEPDVVRDHEAGSSGLPPSPQVFPRVAEKPDHGPAEREVVQHVAPDGRVLRQPRARPESPSRRRSSTDADRPATDARPSRTRARGRSGRSARPRLASRGAPRCSSAAQAGSRAERYAARFAAAAAMSLPAWTADWHLLGWCHCGGGVEAEAVHDRGLRASGGTSSPGTSPRHSQRAVKPRLTTREAPIGSTGTAAPADRSHRANWRSWSARQVAGESTPSAFLTGEKSSPAARLDDDRVAPPTAARRRRTSRT